MRVHPLEFTTESVRAILAGVKTQTRRNAVSEKGRASTLATLKPGDKIYLREAIRWHPGNPPAVYDAAPLGVERETVDMSRAPAGWTPRGEKTASRYAPKWSNRLVLTLRDVRIERVRDISETDAVAEGMVTAMFVNGWTHESTPQNESDYFAPYGLFERSGQLPWRHAPVNLRRGTAARSYAALWDEMHRAEGRRFQDGPDVVVLDFAGGIERACVLDLIEDGEG